LHAYVGTTLLTVSLETGRTHQIRVHLAALHHPCVGDPMYGADPVLAARLGLDRQWLHAVHLGFWHPTSGEYMEFSSPYPADLQHALEVVADG
jgi:23S rRNA pseudouridine1911/1915/1917 synthase